MSNQFIVTPFFLDQPSPELETLAQPGWVINRPILPDGDVQRRLSALHQPIAENVARAIARSNRPVSIAGDCCTAIGVLAGLQRAGHDPILLWLDAHGDFNTWETTPSGFIGGMPLAMIVGRGEQTLVNAVNLRPLPEAQVILAGGRDLDPAERKALAASGVQHLADSRSLLGYPFGAHPVYIHFDVDIVNPKDAPAVGYPAQGGPSVSEMRTLFRSLAQAGQIIAVSMAAWNAKLDRDGQSQAVFMSLLQTLIDT